MQPEADNGRALGGKALAHLPDQQRRAAQGERFRKYLSLFNARKYDLFPEYYSGSVEYVMDSNSGKFFHGPQAIVDLYRQLHEYFDERVELVNLAPTDSLIAAEAHAFMRAKREFDLEGFIAIPQGQVLEMTSFNHYDLDDAGKIIRIRLGIQSTRYLPDDGSFFP